MKKCLEETELDLFGVVDREVVEVLVEEAEVRAEWEAHVPVPVLVGAVCALTAEQRYPIRQEHPATT